MMAAAEGMELYVARVSSADNIADIPSREVRAAVANVIAFVVVACCDGVAGVDTKVAKEHRRAESGGSVAEQQPRISVVGGLEGAMGP